MRFGCDDWHVHLLCVHWVATTNAPGNANGPETSHTRCLWVNWTSVATRVHSYQQLDSAHICRISLQRRPLFEHPFELLTPATSPVLSKLRSHRTACAIHLNQLSSIVRWTITKCHISPSHSDAMNQHRKTCVCRHSSSWRPYPLITQQAVQSMEAQKFHRD